MIPLLYEIYIKKFLEFNCEMSTKCAPKNPPPSTPINYINISPKSKLSMKMTPKGDIRGLFGGYLINQRRY